MKNTKPYQPQTKPQNPDVDLLEEEKVLTEKEEIYQIVIYNDDVTTFETVITALIEICSHEELQAIQCADLIHRTGKCSVKVGTYYKLQPLCEEILFRKISATIDPLQ